MDAGRRVIVGLGNPGSEYAHTRHNVGFDAVDAFARANHIPWGTLSRGAKTARSRWGEIDLILIKPMTYMNLSGEPLSRLLQNSPVLPSELIVVVDDIHLPIGKLRIRPGGSDGGHNGLKSVTAHLRTHEYPRLRIGVDEPGDSSRQIDYVLGKFSRDEQKQMDEVIERVTAALETWLDDGTEAAMNSFNGG